MGTVPMLMSLEATMARRTHLVLRGGTWNRETCDESSVRDCPEYPAGDHRTDHSVEISELHYLADSAKTLGPRPGTSRSTLDSMIKAALAAAALLEVHDSTGISLDNWTPVREFVEDQIGCTILENEV